MEYVQERVATLHDFTGPRPDAPLDETAVVVPMTEREHASLAAERVLTALEDVDPARVVVPLRADDGRVHDVRDWLSSFELAVEVVWCDGPRLRALLDEEGLNGRRGKGRDVWLGLGVASESPYVVVHDADARSYSRSHVPRLLFPLVRGRSFAKGYYARVENRRLYGRLFRLFFAPLVRALRDAHDAPVLEYLASFRYALAGEFAATRDLVRSLRVQRGWGLEVGTLGDAFAHAGFAGSAQVDLGVHHHAPPTVGGPAGLSEMSAEVGEALLRVVEEGGVVPDYGTLPARYREAAEAFLDGYALDAAFNGLEHDRAAERDQVAAYAEAIDPPGPDARLPAWRDAPVSPAAVVEAVEADLADADGA